MKTQRQQKLLEIIRGDTIETQVQLAEALAQEDFIVTQATISRDIKELKLIKIQAEEGKYKYAVRAHSDVLEINNRIERLFKETVISIEDSGNIIVLKTIKGAAMGVAAMMDDLEWTEVLGSIAGDDTIFLAIKPPKEVVNILSKLNRLLK